ncbi:hypothetical protein HY839_01780 [Candidatus Azambacteria bacterium]|nr:hypothetical protein [Candidatus Azambacteria bacterium]
MAFIVRNKNLGVVSLLLCFAFLLVAAGSVRAQTDIPDLGLDELSAPSVELIPSSGGTLGSFASITAKTANIDDNFASFDWYLDDQPMLTQSGKAKTSFSFTTTKPFHTVRLSIIEDGKKIAENAVSVSSFNVSLVWRTNTFVPADYEGKALPIVGSTITLTAFPDIKGESPDNLLYTWSVDAESRVRNVLGEQEFSFTVMKNVSAVFVSVEVSTLNQSSTASKAVSISLAKPQVLLSSVTPLFLFPGEKIDLMAQPYYFNIANATDLLYEWSFGGKSTLGIPPDPNALTLAIPSDSGTGSQMLGVSAENRRTPGETGRTSLEINIL